ncbi:ribbon-helix-helix domain-containing protein [Salmonella enterica]|nr:ribbon-helix-helix domain-containing protein [Salmonella enterica]EBA7134385.1 ribbon-helix-helix domain-containing protein [Salmonella enterica]EJQ5250323.1 ribbon-helix-helix domain-containing protein [Salmonella enterica]
MKRTLLSINRFFRQPFTPNVSFCSFERRTPIPKSRLLDEAIADLLKKHGVTVPADDRR